jgi:hypothetical protein
MGAERAGNLMGIMRKKNVALVRVNVRRENGFGMYPTTLRME